MRKYPYLLLRKLVGFEKSVKSIIHFPDKISLKPSRLCVLYPCAQVGGVGGKI